jgi:predicted nucleic acid-binding protein
VNAIQLFEVYKVILRDLSEERAIAAITSMRRAEIVPVDEYLALAAAEVALEHRLAMADSLIYATAKRANAELITGDTDFEGLPGVVLVR